MTIIRLTRAARRCAVPFFAAMILLQGIAPSPVSAQEQDIPRIDDEQTLVDPQQPGGPQGANQESSEGNAATSGPQPANADKSLDLLTLLWSGGFFMIPLGLLSFATVAIAIERSLALREDRLFPRQFMRELGNLSRNEEGFDPRSAFRACQSWPSSAARVIRVLLLKAGRPQAEIEHAVSEASQREASRLQSTVSWLTLIATVAPLIGLLGTVWGMIEAFFQTTQLLPGQNKAEQLASGIYVALVTTLAGLVIAIPSAILAHWFDSRILKSFHKIEELAASLIPMLEPWEGKVRAGTVPADDSDNHNPFGGADNGDPVPRRSSSPGRAVHQN